jgi:hypothetical protein
MNTVTTRARRARRAGVAPLALYLVVLGTACGGGKDGDRPGGAGFGPMATGEPGPGAAPPPLTEPTIAMPPSAGASACPTGQRAGASGPDQASACLYAAWKEANRAKAEAVASVDAVDALFRERWSAPEGTVTPCTPGSQEGSMTCSFEHHGANYVLDARRSEGGWRVTQVQGPLR